MAITFNCQCGKILAARDTDVGKKAVCPGCGQKMLVPATGGMAEAASPFDRPPQWYEKVEGWMFSQQRRLWQIAGALLAGGLGIYVGFVVLGGGAEPPPAEPEIPAKIAARDFQAFDQLLGQEPWATDFASFSHDINTAVKENQNPDKLFADRPIRWTVTFSSFRDEALHFKEASPLLDDNLGIYVWATILPLERKIVDKLKVGDRITLRGKIASTTSGRSTAHPLGYVQIGPVHCTVQPTELEQAVSTPPVADGNPAPSSPVDGPPKSE